jgi:hypothetical protein
MGWTGVYLAPKCFGAEGAAHPPRQRGNTFDAHRARTAQAAIRCFPDVFRPYHAVA